MIVLQVVLSNNYGMQTLTPTLLHEFNDWPWGHSTTKYKVYTMIIISKMWIGLIPMNISP
jgi:hypothetical protein